DPHFDVIFPEISDDVEFESELDVTTPRPNTES
ncbi:ArsR family transcriptional regulator, partial [Halorubrum sp. Atlit-26R]